MVDPVRDNRVILTYDDYLSLPNDRNRYEILEGELVVTPAPNLKHQRVSGALSFILKSYLKESRLGEVFSAPVDVILDESTITQPDIVVVLKERYGIYTSRGIEGAPDLVVEILSPATARYDRVSKLQLYARFGVRWYWIVDPDEETLQEYELAEETFRLKGGCSKDEHFMPAFPSGLTINLSEVFAPPPM